MIKSAKWFTLVLLAATPPAFSGEITGSGEYTPVHSYRASSICSFSGLNDDGLGPSTQVQAYGAFVALFGPKANPATSPGIACRGN